jgi:hypothetical protein
MVRLVARFHDMYYEPVYRRLYSQVSEPAANIVTQENCSPMYKLIGQVHQQHLMLSMLA